MPATRRCPLPVLAPHWYPLRRTRKRLMTNPQPPALLSGHHWPCYSSRPSPYRSSMLLLLPVTTMLAAAAVAADRLRRSAVQSPPPPPAGPPPRTSVPCAPVRSSPLQLHLLRERGGQGWGARGRGLGSVLCDMRSCKILASATSPSSVGGNGKARARGGERAERGEGGRTSQSFTDRHPSLALGGPPPACSSPASLVKPSAHAIAANSPAVAAAAAIAAS